MTCEGSCLQNGGLTLLLISLPAEFDDRSLEAKIGIWDENSLFLLSIQEKALPLLWNRHGDFGKG